MPFRDQTESCPRCAADLIDAGSARGCPGCRGVWLDITILSEMIEAMRSQPEPVELVFVPEPRTPLACPNCTKPMATFRLHAVAIDRCDRHGVWFDRDELQDVLLASADPVVAAQLRRLDP